LDALLENDKEAEVAPLACGVKVTAKVVDWPEGIVTGIEIPESTNSPFVRLADETVTAVPLAVRLPFRDTLDPTPTLPNLRLVGDTANVPAAVPVPERLMVSGEFEAFETTDTLPLAAPATVGAKVAVNVTLWLAVRVRGRFNPLREKPVPLTLACEMVTDDPPVLVRVSDKFMLLPTWTLPNASVVGLEDKEPGAVPVPESVMFRLGFEPFEVIPTAPLADPLAVGWKVTVNEELCPAAKVKGKESPLKLNPVPLATAAEIVRLVPPVLVRVSDRLELAPTWTLPKARAVGFGVNVPWAVPVPERVMLRLGFEPFEVIPTVPLADPLTVGPKVTVNEVLCPAAKVKGKDSPLKLNPVPLATAAEIVRLVPPVLVRASDRLELAPTWTLPNARAVGFGVNVPWVVPVPERVMLRLGFEPFEVIPTVPLADPLTVGLKVTVNEVLCPAAKVKGKESPLKLNPVPLATAAEIVRLVPPVLVRASDRLELAPTWTLPKARAVGFGVNVPWVVPVPERETFRVVFDAVEVMAILPLAVPDVVGEKSAVNEVLWPAAKVNGRDRPLKLNPGPLAAAAEMVRLVPPEFVNVSDSGFEVPTCTLPNASLLGLAVNTAGATPLPDKGKFKVEFEAFETKATLPLEPPADWGAKITEKLTLCPAPIVRGKAMPFRVKPGPLRVAWEIVTLDVPELPKTALSVSLLPTWTFPKLRLLGLTVSCPAIAPVPVSRTVVRCANWRVRLPDPEYSRTMLPVVPPLAWGAKVVVKLPLWPTANVSGKLIPLTLNPVPATSAR
jgi:hypothetical protein